MEVRGFQFVGKDRLSIHGYEIYIWREPEDVITCQTYEMLSISSWDGTVTSNEFQNAASTFVELWNKFDLGFPHWSWINCPKRPGFAASKVEGYLSLENMILPRSSEEDQHQCGLAGVEDLACSSEDIFNDSAILVQKDGKERHHYDFHVIYSSSFRVPVLYFHAYCSDGEPLAIEDLEKGLSCLYCTGTCNI